MGTRKVYVGASEIHGRGLFAATRIKAGELIGRVKTVPATREGPYVLWLSADNAVEVRGHLRYINHSDRPNACYYDTLEVVALTDIHPGQEITHDYDAD